jgi:hypothetical protein
MRPPGVLLTGALVAAAVTFGTGVFAAGAGALAVGVGEGGVLQLTKTISCILAIIRAKQNLNGLEDSLGENPIMIDPP